MIHYRTIWDTGKNYGRAINLQMGLIPSDDWVCLVDGDAMFLTDYWGRQIEDIVRSNPQYSVIGCMTNRLRGAHQLVNGEFSDNPDVLHHQAIANRLWEDNYSTVEPTKDAIAGMFMLFPKSVWSAVKFRENTAAFDTWFCRSVQAKGGKIGVAKGLYVFHRYRLGKENAIENNKHLFR